MNIRYLLFTASQRQQVMFTHPDYSFKDVAVELGTRWKDLSDQDKIPFQTQAQADKVRYIKAIAAYEKKKRTDGNLIEDGGFDSDDEAEMPVKKSRKVKDKNAPKGVLTAYILYSNTQRQLIKNEHPDYSFTDTASELGVRWRSLSDKEKIPFQKLAEADKVRYISEMAYYVKSQNNSDGDYNEDGDVAVNDNCDDDCNDDCNDNDSKSYIIDKPTDTIPTTVGVGSVLLLAAPTPYNMTSDTINV
jgi:hypothetical protein